MGLKFIKLYKLLPLKNKICQTWDPCGKGTGFKTPSRHFLTPDFSPGVISLLKALILLSSYLNIGFPLPAYATLTNNEIDHLLACYHQKMSAQKTGPDKYADAFRHYPKEKLYKLFIDKDRLANPQPNEQGIKPHLIFDIEEPGYYQSMMDAFEALPFTIGKPISLSSIAELHDVAVGKIPSMMKGITSLPMEYYLDTDSYEDALNELFISKILYSTQKAMETLSEQPLCRGVDYTPSFMKTERMQFLSIASKKEQKLRIKSNGLPTEKIETLITPILSHYYKSISHLDSLQDKLSAIAELLRALEVAHFLPDGNQRTYSFLLLNKLLIENNIPPAILDDPYLFDGFMTVQEMANEIKIGIVNFLNENEESQRSFALKECHDFHPTLLESYLRLDNLKYKYYYSTFTTAPFQRISDSTKEAINQAISTKKIHENLSNSRHTPLHFATYLGSLELAEQLVRLGASPFTFPFVDSPLALAKHIGSLKVAKKLLKESDNTIIDQGYLEDAISSWIKFKSDRKNNSEDIKDWLEIMSHLLQSADRKTLSRSKVRNAFSHALNGADTLNQFLINYLARQYGILLDQGIALN